MPRLDRGIQYAAAFRFNHKRLWNAGSPGWTGRWQSRTLRQTAPHTRTIMLRPRSIG